MRLYHGTIPIRADGILNPEQLKPTGISPWSCSDGDDYVYFWHPEALAEAMGQEGEDEEHKAYMCLQSACESATIAAAMADKPQTTLVVLVFEVDEELIEEDDSCENMSGSGAVRVREDAPMRLVERWEASHNARLDAFHVSGLLDNHNLTPMDDDLREAAQAIAQAGAYIETCHEPERVA